MIKFGRRPGFPSKGTFEQITPGRTPANVAEDILRFLSDDRLHDSSEVAEIVGLPERDAEKILSFLMQGGLVEKGVRITKSGRIFLTLPV
jgi:predicted transcriptional regulator